VTGFGFSEVGLPTEAASVASVSEGWLLGPACAERRLRRRLRRAENVANFDGGGFALSERNWLLGLDSNQQPSG